jgi:hypothetical protein
LRAFSNFVLWLVICCALASCHSPRRFAGTDSSDRPQADLRDKLSSRLPDLFAVPRSPIGYSITRLIRTGFYSEQFDLVAEFDQDTGTTEQIVWYKWDSTAHQYAWRDRLLIEGVASIEVRDIDNDHRNEVILQVTRTSDAAHGLWIIGHRKDSLGLAVRFRSDSTAPTFIRLSDSSLALIEHSESLADRLLRTFHGDFLNSKATTINPHLQTPCGIRLSSTPATACIKYFFSSEMLLFNLRPTSRLITPHIFKHLPRKSCSTRTSF